MTPEMKWFDVEIDHVQLTCCFDISLNGKLKDAFNRKNTPFVLKGIHQRKGVKYTLLDYRLQLINAYQFLKLNKQKTTKIFLMKFTVSHQ